MTPSGPRTRWLAPIGAAALLVLSLVRGEGVFPAAAVDHPLAVAACLALGIVVARQETARRVLRHAVYESSPAVYHLALFVAAATGAAIVSVVVFGSLPRLDDGVAALFQARIFATGRITLPLPQHAEFFEQFGVLGGRAGIGHWCGMYPPGWPALLALGVLAGAPWLVNPLLGGALVVAIAALGREVYGDRIGRIAGALAVASPITILLAASHLSHTTTALALAVCLWALCRLLKTGASAYGAVAGLAFGVG
ncbi:MAG: hypothetical protein ACREQY_13765, partial [Candidatus Binatia bacterium]